MTGGRDELRHRGAGREAECEAAAAAAIACEGAAAYLKADVSGGRPPQSCIREQWLDRHELAFPSLF